jgi:hypothetical protein
MRTKILALLLCFAIIQVSTAVAKDDGGYNVMYDGGSLPGLKAGKKLRMYIETNQIRLMDGKTLVTTLVPSTIQDVAMAKTFIDELVQQSALRLYPSGSVA